MCDCSRCKFCEKDYYYDDELGEELVALYCEKEHDTDDLDFECNDFEEYKPKPYVEKYTECDMCEHLSNCKESGLFIETTTIHDITRHFVCDKSKCLKNELPWATVGNWEPVVGKEIGKPQEKIEVANFESDWRKNAVYLEDDCK